jgi:DNA polymerase-3 subunit alpha
MKIDGRTPFVHLHCHSDYSLLDGACDILKLIQKVVQLGMPAVALTDHGNLFGAVQFYHEAREQGVHPVIGCEVYLSQQGHKVRSDTDRYNHLVLLCETQEGYRNLIQLASTAFLEGFYYKPRIDKDLLARHAKGLIGLSACLRGEINETLAADRYEEGKRLAYTFTDILGRGNFFLEVQDHGLEQDGTVVPAMVRLSRETGIPLVATNDAHYLRREDARSERRRPLRARPSPVRRVARQRNPHDAEDEHVPIHPDRFEPHPLRGVRERSRRPESQPAGSASGWLRQELC